MIDLLDEDLKTAILKMPKELKEDEEKAILCEQNGNIYKEM